jgi:hypothetical protein
MHKGIEKWRDRVTKRQRRKKYAQRNREDGLIETKKTEKMERYTKPHR